MNKKFMIGGCAAIAVAGNVFAADEDYSYFNPYASLKGGYAFLGKRNDIKYKGGFAGAVELGVSYDAWRLGLELGFKSNKIKEFELGKPLGEVVVAAANFGGWHKFEGSLEGMNVVVTGDNGGANPWKYEASKLSKVNALTGMVNVCYDYAMTEAWSIYAGLGLGVAKVSYTIERSTGVSANAAAKTGGNVLDPTTITALKGEIVKDLTKTEYSKTVFAWQWMAGVGYEFNENWKLTLGYKLFNTAKVKLGDTKIKTPFNHTAEVGLTYTF